MTSSSTEMEARKSRQVLSDPTCTRERSQRAELSQPRALSPPKHKRQRTAPCSSHSQTQAYKRPSQRAKCRAQACFLV